MSTYFKAVDSNSYLDFQSHHFRGWKENIQFGQFRRIRKNWANDHKFEKQAEIIRKRFREKGYTKNLVMGAYEKARKSNQMEYLIPKKETPHTSNTKEDKPLSKTSSFITTYNSSHALIRKILQKNWFLVKEDPFLREILPKKTKQG